MVLKPVPDIRILAVIVSLVLSAWAAYTVQTINNDGIIYIASAEQILRGDWNLAYQLYNWLTYPAFIAFTGTITGFSAETSAQIVDALFSAMLVFSFLTLSKHLGADRKTLLIAAFVILFHPYINDSREEIIRDHGYWALYLTAILFFFRFYRNPCWKYGVLWSLCMVAATLFRIEGLVFVILLPLVLFLLPRNHPARTGASLRQVNIVAIGLAFCIASISLISPDFYSSWAGRLGEPGQRFDMLWSGLSSGLSTKADAVRSGVLTPWSDDYALSVVYAALILMLIDKIVRTLTPLYSLLPFFPKLRSRFNPTPGTILILAWAVILNIMVVSVFLVTEFFISSRYIVPLVLVLLTITPFVLASLHDHWTGWRNAKTSGKILFVTAFLVLTFMTADGVIALKGSNRIYLRDAGEWIRTNIDSETRVFTNDQMVRYYSGYPITKRDTVIRKTDFGWLKQNDWKRFRYLAIAINRYTQPTDIKKVESLKGQVLQTFHNARNERVIILQMR